MLPAKSEVKWVEVDLGVVRANVRWIKSRLSPKTVLMAVVKEDAYGHGGAEISREAIRGGASSLGVLTVREAAALRRAGIKASIQLLAPVLPSSARDIFKWRLIPTIDDLEQARAINAAAPASGAAVHVDLNFGLGRWGVSPRNTAEFLDALSRLRRLSLRGLSTHIDYVPGKNAVEAEEKLRSFSSMASRLKKHFPGLICHAANSSVLLDFPHRQMDMVRVGNLLYGVKPSSFPAPIRSPWSLKARIVSLREVERGRSIGYAGEYIAPKRMRIGTLLCGYADGVAMEPAERFISLGSGFQYWGIVRGRKAPFIGRCGIAHILVDVTGIAGVRRGDVVTLPARRTATSPRVPRFYRE